MESFSNYTRHLATSPNSDSSDEPEIRFLRFFLRSIKVMSGVNRRKWDGIAESSNSAVGSCSGWRGRYLVTVSMDFSILQSILKGYVIALLKMATPAAAGSVAQRYITGDVSRKSRKAGLKRMKREEKGVWESVKAFARQ